MTTEEARKKPEVIEWKKYKKQEGTGVNKYAILKNGLFIRFVTDPHNYTYNFLKPGKDKVDDMKTLAEKGEGLSSYISRFVKGNYFEKWLPEEELESN